MQVDAYKYWEKKYQKRKKELKKDKETLVVSYSII